MKIAFPRKTHASWYGYNSKKYFDQKDWQIVRLIRCVTCNKKSAKLLQLDKTALDQSSKSPKKVLAMLDHVRHLSGRTSAELAARSSILVLSCFQKKYEWVREHQMRNLQASTLAHAFRWNGHKSPLRVIWKRMTQTMMPNLSKKGSKMFEEMQFEGNVLQFPHGAVLLKKGYDWPDETASWCLLVVENLDINDQCLMGLTIRAVEGQGNIYSLKCQGYDSVGDMLHRDDERITGIRQEEFKPS